MVFDFTTGQDLCTGTYFNNAVPVVSTASRTKASSTDSGLLQIDLQIAKQGFRLAAWLNVLFDGSTML